MKVSTSYMKSQEHQEVVSTSRQRGARGRKRLLKVSKAWREKLKAMKKRNPK